MRYRILSAGLLVFLFLEADAQEMWLQPGKFRVAPGQNLEINFVVGEGFPGDLWDGTKQSAASLRWLMAGGEKDLASDLAKPGTEHFSLTLISEGTSLLCMASNPSSRKWDGKGFDEYLENNGLENVMAARRSSAQSGLEAVERITWFAKLLVQAGAKTDDTYKRNAGARLEIVPESNPYLLQTGDHLTCRILFNGKPSPHTLVKVWSRINHTSFVQNLYTEDDGSVQFPISMRGTWMVTTTRMVSAGGAEWEGLRASLVFGI